MYMSVNDFSFWWLLFQVEDQQTKVEDLSDLLSEYDLPQGMYVCTCMYNWATCILVHVPGNIFLSLEVYWKII